MSAPKWDTQLELELSREEALRVIPAKAIERMARVIRRNASSRTVERWTADAVKAGRLVRAQRGLYLNRMTHPPAQAVEAAPWLRRGAVVSLQTVLGEAGVWNNYTNQVTCIVPLRKDVPLPSLGRVETLVGIFTFYGVPLAVLEAGRREDRLDVPRSLGYERATPEAALLHWLYLGCSPRSALSIPPLELDVSVLDAKKLPRLAVAQGMASELENWAAARRLRVSLASAPTRAARRARPVRRPRSGD